MSRARNTTTAPTGSIAPLGLRLLPELREQIEKAAKDNGRSLNAEVSARLQQSFEPANTERIGDLELALAQEQITSALARGKLAEYSAALMLIAGRLPPGAFDDTPAVSNILKEVNTDREAKILETLEQMLADTKGTLNNMHHLIAIGKIKVTPSESQ